jgi:hypothetical protein
MKLALVNWQNQAIGSKPLFGDFERNEDVSTRIGLS